MLRKALLKKVESNFKVCTFRLQHKASFQQCIKYSSLILGPYQPSSIQFMWKTDYTDFVVVPRGPPAQVAFVAQCSSLFENLLSHLTAKVLITL